MQPPGQFESDVLNYSIVLAARLTLSGISLAYYKCVGSLQDF